MHDEDGVMKSLGHVHNIQEDNAGAKEKSEQVETARNSKQNEKERAK